RIALLHVAMDVLLTHRGRRVDSADVAFICELIAAHPTLSRRKLSVKLCEAWGWSQANGHPRDMVCRSLMLELHRAGLIELPPVRQVSANPLAVRHKPAPVTIDKTPIEGSLHHLPSIEFRQV